MFQGTGSSVGKSLIVAGLCRALHRRGIAVRPFKPQNMSNNAAVTPDGGEIGRAQALQAQAAGVPPSIHMNPVLLKPQSEIGSQLVVQGRMQGTVRARAYQSLKPSLLPSVLDSFQRLQNEAEIVLVEGAGSASEINLRPGDIANMGFARATNTPVIIIGDIDRGGVIASLVGTHAVLDEADAALIRGFIVNRMRGDPTLFAEGMAFIARRTTWPPLGLLPHFHPASTLPAEDAADLAPARSRTAPIKIAVPLLPMIANFDDLDPLRAEPSVELILITPGQPLPICDLVLLPGSKSTIADLAAFRAAGWDGDLLGHQRRGGQILGVCGGYQMLGQSIADPEGTEGPPAKVPGLGLLSVETTLTGEKRLEHVRGQNNEGIPLDAYAMHTGRTTGPDTTRPLFRLEAGQSDGATSKDGLVTGTYMHGLFANDAQRAVWLRRLGAPPSEYRHAEAIESTLDALAAHLEQHLDIPHLVTLAQ